MGSTKLAWMPYITSFRGIFSCCIWGQEIARTPDKNLFTRALQGGQNKQFHLLTAADDRDQELARVPYALPCMLFPCFDESGKGF
jgi:hypothetical protein